MAMILATTISVAESNTETTDREAQNAAPMANDTWDLIESNIGIPLDPSEPKVIEQIRWYTKNKAHIEAASRESTNYLYHVLKEIDARKLPRFLALVPMAESAFEPFAYSRAHASGIWQFIPSTGAAYGLKQTWWYDGRRDLIAATEAALTYLMRLNEVFAGDWTLTLAAYNAGEGRIQTALAQHEKTNRDHDLFDLDLPKETERYVAGVMALAVLLVNRDSYDIKWHQVPTVIPFTVIESAEQIHIERVAQTTGLSVKDLFRMNPALKRWATDPDGPHRILIPIAQ